MLYWVRPDVCPAKLPVFQQWQIQVTSIWLHFLVAQTQRQVVAYSNNAVCVLQELLSPF